jgi:hypothetical protein
LAAPQLPTSESMAVSYRHTNLSIYAPPRASAHLWRLLPRPPPPTPTLTHLRAGYHHDTPSLPHPTTFLHSLVNIVITALLPSCLLPPLIYLSALDSP